MTESETKFNEMLDEYIHARVPRKKMTAAQWKAFEKTTEGKEYWNRWDAAKEEFYLMAISYMERKNET